jgi:metal-responsive CopG/Arc/MetJ family transcriptional regulator
MRKDVRMTVRIPTNLSLPADLVRDLDAIAGKGNRSAFVEAAVRKAIKREQLRLAFERSAGILKTEDYPYWSTSDKVVEWVREARAEETDSGPEPDGRLTARQGSDA